MKIEMSEAVTLELDKWLMESQTFNSFLLWNEDFPKFDLIPYCMQAGVCKDFLRTKGIEVEVRIYLNLTFTYAPVIYYDKVGYALDVFATYESAEIAALNETFAILDRKVSKQST